MSCGKPVLALYDFRSKQSYIYRTNRMREITGASELIASMYKVFMDEKLIDRDGKELLFRSDWRTGAPIEFDGEGYPLFAEDEAGIVVYEGGGNLCILYRDEEAYESANRVFSRIVLERGYSLSLVAGCSGWEVDPEDKESDASFKGTLDAAYAALEVKKRIGTVAPPCNVLPFTQVDAVTYQPIVEKGKKGTDEYELTQEARCKRAAWDDRARRERQADKPGCIDLDNYRSAWERSGNEIDDVGTEKDEDSLIAVVYFDGNSIGDRLQERGTTIEGMRAFSKEVHDVLVTQTEEAIKQAIEGMPDEKQQDYRIIVDHGDEITLICNAHAAPLAIQAYFESLARDAEEHKDNPDYRRYHACAGMAVCHAHDPFSEVYRIAEECCESGKQHNRAVCRQAMEGLEGDEAIRASREAEASYVDFHYVRSGITGSLKQIRAAQDAALTQRPYKVGGSYDTFLGVGGLLYSADNDEVGEDERRELRIRRSDLKALTRAILRGDSWFELEYERIKQKDVKTVRKIEGMLSESGEGAPFALLRNTLFDVTSLMDVYDVMFAQLATQEGGAEDE